jgi:hypothetical protein
MARSVYIPSGAVKAAFADASWMQESYEFDDAVEDAYYALRAKYPSLKKPAGQLWLGREARVILENKLVGIAVSEYCGLVAISVVPKAGAPFADGFADKVDPSIAAVCFGSELVYRGSFSNGEAIFDSKAGANKGEMGLGYSSKEGWI